MKREKKSDYLRPEVVIEEIAVENGIAATTQNTMMTDDELQQFWS